MRIWNHIPHILSLAFTLTARSVSRLHLLFSIEKDVIIIQLTLY